MNDHQSDNGMDAGTTHGIDSEIPAKLITIPNEKWATEGGQDERTLIGIALADRVNGEQILSQLTPEEFSNWELSRLFRIMHQVRTAERIAPSVQTLDDWLHAHFAKVEDVGKAMECVHSCVRWNGFYEVTDVPNIITRIKGRHAQAAGFEVMKQGLDKLLRITNPLEGVQYLEQLKDKLQKVDSTASHLPIAVPLDSFNHSANNGGNLLGHRFICRGGALLLAAPTGIGKSSWSLQGAISWALGKPHLGIQPAGKLRSLVIQAENDDGDMAELRDGVYRGLNLSTEEQAEASRNVQVVCETIATGTEFIKMTNALVAKHRPDILWVDPLFAYLGDSVVEQKAVSAFLRNGLNPILKQYSCGLILVHHTNKPQAGKEKATAKAGDFAYLGSGSAELANWARAVVAIRNVGEHNVFEMIFGKRGKRAGLLDQWKNPVYSLFIHHSQTGICWEVGDAPAGVRVFNKIDVLNLIPTTDPITQTKLFNTATELGIGERRVRNWLKELEEDGDIYTIAIPRSGTNPAKTYQRKNPSQTTTQNLSQDTVSETLSVKNELPKSPTEVIGNGSYRDTVAPSLPIGATMSLTVSSEKSGDFGRTLWQD